MEDVLLPTDEEREHLYATYCQSCPERRGRECSAWEAILKIQFGQYLRCKDCKDNLTKEGGIAA